MRSILQTLSGLWGSFRQLTLTTQIASGTLLALVVVLGSLNLPLQNQPVSTQAAETKTLNLSTQTVGAESEAFATFASWPGEVISPNDADVQPPRSGTIISWDVSIGQYVNAGSVLGRLSAAPLTPELATTLAQQASALAQAKVRASSTKTFVSQAKGQLTTFSNSEAAQRAIEDAKRAVTTSAENVRNTLQRALIQEYAEFSGGGRDLLSTSNTLYNTQIPYYFGATNSGLRDKYLSAIGKALDAIEKNVVPEQEGSEYFLAVTRLAASSISSGDYYSQARLEGLREQIAGHQAEFNEAIEKYRGAVLNVSEKEKEYADRQKENSENVRDNATKAIELDREQITAENEFDAADASYRAIAGAVTGGTAIVAPKSGYVSAIMSQIGEFAEPGKAIASISSGVQTNKIIRFRIPSNAEVPKKGDKVKIIRPGFAKDVRTAVITGVGTALDGNGAFMADARVEGALEWPAHLSVRVVPEKRTSQTIAVPFDAVFWDEENQPQVWLVGEGGSIASRAVRTGRTFGDAVEILDGLALGETYISQVSENITEGMRIEEAAVTREEPTTPEGDGHGHAHDE